MITLTPNEGKEYTQRDCARDICVMVIAVKIRPPAR